MRLIEDTIDWSKYLEAPAECARVKPASEWADALVDRFHGPGRNAGSITLPWQKAAGLIELRPGEVTVWGGINGSGKSALLGQVMLSAMEQGAKVCIASMEMAPVVTMDRMARQVSAERWPSIRALHSFSSWTDGKLWLFDHQGTAKHSMILGVMRYCAEELGIDHFVVDSLMKCGLGTDDYTAQKDFVDSLCAWARDYKTHLHLVMHARKGRSEKDHLDKFDLKGAGEIIDQVDNAFIVWRNKSKEEALEEGGDQSEWRNTPDCILRCCKQRHGEWEGKLGLFFDRPSMQYLGTREAIAHSMNIEQVMD